MVGRCMAEMLGRESVSATTLSFPLTCADEGHVASLTGRTLDGAGEGGGLMVSEHGKLVAFDMVEKVFYSEEDGQQLAVKSAVLPLGIGELPGEESHRAPDAAEELLKLTTNCPV